MIRKYEAFAGPVILVTMRRPGRLDVHRAPAATIAWSIRRTR